MVYWIKDKNYIGTLYMNLFFIGYVIWGTLDLIIEKSWWGWYAMMWAIIIAFNIERWLHYKAYGGRPDVKQGRKNSKREQCIIPVQVVRKKH